MTKWDTIQVRITEKERKIIDQFKKRIKIREDGKFLRRVIEDLIGISFADVTRNKMTLPEYYIGIHDFYQDCKAKLDLSKKNKIKLDKLFKERHSSILLQNSKEVNAKLNQIDKIWDTFRKHKKVGKPKSPKHPRGRPKN